MAHKVNRMLNGTTGEPQVGLNNFIAKAVTPQSSNDSLVDKETPSATATGKPFSWRMLQPDRKYQLFPKEKVADAAGKFLDPEQAFAHAMGQSSERSEKSATGTGLRIRIKEHNSLIRRRKISVPELGPMTTVHEVPMDSPTIPGRPPLHERSISAPGASWSSQPLADHVPAAKGQMLDGVAEVDIDATKSKGMDRPVLEARQPLSPKSLTPLVIPTRASMAFQLSRQPSRSRLRPGSTPMDATLRSACSRTAESPLTATKTPFTPLTASTAFTSPASAVSNTTAYTLPTPISAPAESRSSPRPWDRLALPHTTHDSPHKELSSLVCPSAKPESDCVKASESVHRRNQSETGSIMERGRPRKRSETATATAMKRTVSKRSNSAERRAFEHLPKGWKASDAINMLDPSEAAALQKQAMDQASRFEVLRKDDVDKLSRELRNLHERADYLRRTYTSLRAGRRNLQTRICQYLRSPRTAKFSHESMLKQEEALAELDASIDDWVAKLEQAENRRTRVRQKLLEHVAAATTLPVPDLSPPTVGVSETLRLAMGMRPPPSVTGAGNLSTPPRSPAKTVFIASYAPRTQSSSPSPQRVVAQVPSTILEQSEHEEEAATVGLALSTTPDDDADAKRRAETIHIFADNDVYALLADVEDQITKMGGDMSSTSQGAAVSEQERRELHRARSEELLNRHLPVKTSTPKPEPARTEQMIFLTNAVFKP